MNLYCTFDTIGTGSGGGQVTRQELGALTELGATMVIERTDIQPECGDLPDHPFMQDYATLGLLPGGHVELAHFYAGCFGETVRALRRRGTKVAYSVDAHDRAASIEEFRRCGITPFPFRHISDDDLYAIYSRGYREADLFICSSNRAKSICEADLQREAIVIPHGCTLPDAVAPLPQRFVVGYLGAIGPDKGVRYLVGAWSAMTAAPVGQLLLGGPYSGQLLPVLQEAGIPYGGGHGRVELTGYVPQIADFYNRLAVYVQPSVTEGFGLEVLEAMAHGRPVIVSDGAGAADCVRDGVDGYVVPARDVAALVDRLRHLASHPELIAQMGARARTRAADYTWDKVRAQYQTAWRTLQ